MNNKIKLLIIMTIFVIFSPVVNAEYYNYDVPYLRQLDYDDINESACGPTSIAMILQYYYPNSGIDVPDVYHSGIQGYSYSGPATGYKDVSFQSPNTGLDIVDEEFRKYYPEYFMPVNDRYSGLRSPDAAAQYLNNIWGGDSSVVYGSFQNAIDEIKVRPLILNINYSNTYGHYVVLRGYNDSGTPYDFSDDLFYVNDPYTKWTGHPDGENREFDYVTLSTWYNHKRRIITFNPTLDENQRQFTVVVDNNHINPNFELDDVNVKDEADKYIWWEYYGSHGNWYYPNEDNHSVEWIPNLPIDGIYKIHAIYFDNNNGRDIKYEIYYPDNPELPIGMKLVKQFNDNNWRDAQLGTFYLKEGSYVKIKDVPAQANVDTVRFEYISPPESLDLIFLIDTTGSMGDDIANVKASASEIVEAIDSKGYDYRIAIADYRDYPVAPYGGWLDYPYHLDLPFSNDKNDIINAINGLTLGWGGDWQESVYSGLVAAMKDPCKEIPCESSANYGWREGVNKAIILIGDAPPHDKDLIHEIDPIFDCDTCPGGCTIEDVAYWSENIDPILVYSVVIGSDSTVYNAFSEISERTGGKVYTSLTASDIVDTIIEVIGDIGETPNLGVSVDIDPIINLINPGNSVTYSISLTNTGTITDTYDLSIDLENFVGGYRGYPTSIQETWINLDKTSVEIEPDATETVSLTISVPNNWAGMEDIIYPFNVIIKSETDELIINSSAAELEVIADKRSMIEYSKLETIWLSELIQSASIDDEIKNSLLDKLTNATLKLDQAILNVESGKYNQANNMLRTSQNVINAFINQVEAQYDKKIMQPDAEMLIGEANTIFEDIESAKNI